MLTTIKPYNAYNASNFPIQTITFAVFTSLNASGNIHILKYRARHCCIFNYSSLCSLTVPSADTTNPWFDSFFSRLPHLLMLSYFPLYSIYIFCSFFVSKFQSKLSFSFFFYSFQFSLFFLCWTDKIFLYFPNIFNQLAIFECCHSGVLGMD